MKKGTYNENGVFVDLNGQPAYSDFPVGTCLSCRVRCSFAELYSLSVTAEPYKIFSVQAADYPGTVGFAERREIPGEKGNLIQLVVSDDFIEWVKDKSQPVYNRLTQKRIVYVRPAAMSYRTIPVSQGRTSASQRPGKTLLLLAAASLFIPLN